MTPRRKKCQKRKKKNSGDAYTVFFVVSSAENEITPRNLIPVEGKYLQEGFHTLGLAVVNNDVSYRRKSENAIKCRFT